MMMGQIFQINQQRLFLILIIKFVLMEVLMVIKSLKVMVTSVMYLMERDSMADQA